MKNLATFYGQENQITNFNADYNLMVLDVKESENNFQPYEMNDYNQDVSHDIPLQRTGMNYINYLRSQDDML